MVANSPVGDIVGGLTQAGGGVVGSIPAGVGAASNYGTELSLNALASAVGGERENPTRLRDASNELLADVRSNIPEGIDRASRGFRNLFGLKEAPSPVMTPAQQKQQAVVDVANKKPQAPQRAVMPEIIREPGMMPRPGFMVGEQPTQAARNPVQDYLDNLAGQNASNAAIRAQALQDLQDASRLDTSSVGDMFVSGVKGRRKGMAAKAALGNVEAMDPNKFISPVIQQGMQSEASRYTADAGAAASRFTAQSAAAAKADDRALKAQLEGPKAAQEAMIYRIMTDPSIPQEQKGNLIAAYKGTNPDVYAIGNDLNTGALSTAKTRGMVGGGTVYPGGTEAVRIIQRAQGIANKVASQKDQASQKAYINALPQADKELYNAYIEQEKKKK
jgi:hypothetical protein